MQIARQKFRENIAEYILYMYQIEDLIRAYSFDVESIIENVVRPQIQNDELVEEYRNWYNTLSADMKQAGAEKKGHMLALKEILVELTYLHNTLLTIVNDKKYLDIVERANTFIEEFKERSDMKNAQQIEIAFQAMYMKLLLRLQKKEISQESEEAFDAMRLMLAYLSDAYRKMKSGDLDFLKN